jgi:hypothetical protein
MWYDSLSHNGFDPWPTNMLDDSDTYRLTIQL